MNFSLDSLNVIESYKQHTMSKKINLLNEASNSRFATGKWNIANDQSNTNYDWERNEIV